MTQIQQTFFLQVILATVGMLFVGNYWHKVLVDYRSGTKSLLAFLEDKVDLHAKHDNVWSIISQIEKFFSTPSPSTEEAERGSQLSEKFGVPNIISSQKHYM